MRHRSGDRPSALDIVSLKINGGSQMSPRRMTEPSTRVSSRSSRTGRSGLIAKGKTEKQSAKESTALDNRFHRTLRLKLCGRGPRAEADAARRLHVRRE